MPCGLLQSALAHGLSAAIDQALCAVAPEGSRAAPERPAITPE
jgi:hypothetical protein